MTQDGDTHPAPRASSSATPTQRILIVDDQPDEGQLCKGILSTVRGWVVRYEQHPLRAQALVREWLPDVVILDVLMDELDGITLSRRLKADSACHATLMFVTSRIEAETELDGLEFADDYVTKPYDEKVLVRRVEKLLERRQQINRSSQTERGRSSSRPDIDAVSMFVRVPHGHDALLTPIEMKLLQALLAGNGKPVPYGVLLKAVWQIEDASDTERSWERRKNRPLLHTNILRLRQKIEMDARQPELIITVPRVGYCYVLRSDQP